MLHTLIMEGLVKLKNTLVAKQAKAVAKKTKKKVSLFEGKTLQGVGG